MASTRPSSERDADRLSAPATKRFWVLLGAVILLALAVRVGHVASVLRSPVGETLILDATYYHEEALRILGKLPAGNGESASFMNVGYPYLLALTYAVFGSSPAVALWFQAIIGALTAGLVALTARQALNADTPAWVAGLVYALYAPAIFYDGLVLTPSLTNAFAAAALLGVARHLRNGSTSALVAGGAAAGVAIFLRSNMVLLPVLLVPLVVRGVARTVGIRRAAVLIGAAAVLPLSITIYDGAAHGEWVPVSANGGMNFWSGNHRNATGQYSATGMVENQNPAEELSVFLEKARRKTGNSDLTLAESSNFWLREGLREILADPTRWLGLEGRKFATYWNGAEAKTNVSISFVDRFSPVLSAIPLRFGALGVLGTAGLVFLFCNRRRQAAWLASAPVLASLATSLLFFVSGEYRHPASLGLSIGTAVLCCELLARLAPKLAPRLRVTSGKSRFGWATLVALVLIPVAARTDPAQATAAHPFIDYFNHARAICAVRGDGSRPSREDFVQARALLERADDSDAEKILFLLDARLWVESLAAVKLQDREAAIRACALAGDILAHDLTAGRSGYSDRFLEKLVQSIRMRLSALAAQPFVRQDPALSREAASLLSRIGPPR